jgi:AcrR family transcriptional regulator|tara:strand:+ start:6094 stop:6639 length:546 start_codon:yes stop_codon:yes gene_type:complete
LEIFGQKGIINSRLDDITKFAGMSNATFYNHFKDKDDLVSAVATSIALELVAAVEEQVVDIKDPAIRLVVSTNTVMRTALQHERWSYVLATAFFLVPEGLIDVGGYLKNNVDRGMAQGVFNTASDEFQLNQLASVFISGLRGLKKDNLSIIDRTSENLLRLLGVTPAKASTILDEAKAFYY